MSNRADFSFRNEGSIFLLRPLTEAAQGWVKENLPEDITTFGGAVVVEARYIFNLVEGLREAGLTLKEGW